MIYEYLFFTTKSYAIHTFMTVYRLIVHSLIECNLVYIIIFAIVFTQCAFNSGVNQ